MVTVLVVDDDPAIGRMLQLILSTEGIEVARVENGPSALLWLDEHNLEPDLVLLDLMMPGMDGREVFREARRNGLNSPVIFCSAYGAAAANRELGGQGAIDKPFNPETLITTVAALVRKPG